MNYPNINYSDLKQLILSLNFKPLSTQGNQKIFEHSSGALIILPNYSDKEQVSLTHITTIGRILDEFNIMNKLDFRNCLEKNQTLV